MGLFSGWFKGGNSNDDVRRDDESFEEYVDRVKEKLKREEPTLENIERLNRDAAIEAGLITGKEYIEKKAERIIKSNPEMYRKYVEETSEPEPEPIGDWYIGNDGYMVRMWSDGVERR